MIELGVRYRAGPVGAQVVLADGSAVLLAPFATITFDAAPLAVSGRLTRLRRGRLELERKA